MKETIQHPTKRWEISIIELTNGETKFKVTRRLPEMEVAETKFLSTKEEVEQQIKEWLS